MSGAVARREFGFTPEDHRTVSALAYQELGIVLPAGKAQLVYGRLAPRVRACGLGSVADYLNRIEGDVAERARALDALTTNHTAFFRESHHFDDFVERLWPMLSARLADGGRVRLWSAACSSGEEPYSWLMAAGGSDRTRGDRTFAGDFRLLATDASPSALATARAGTYPSAALGAAPAALRAAWTMTRGGSVTVDPVLRRAAAFRSLNLLAEWPMRGAFDAIFCRNVMIYFDDPTKTRLQARLADRLVVGGMLYIGHSERLAPEVAPRFQSVGRTSYLKVRA